MVPKDGLRFRVLLWQLDRVKGNLTGEPARWEEGLDVFLVPITKSSAVTLRNWEQDKIISMTPEWVPLQGKDYTDKQKDRGACTPAALGH